MYSLQNIIFNLYIVTSIIFLRIMHRIGIKNTDVDTVWVCLEV